MYKVERFNAVITVVDIIHQEPNHAFSHTAFIGFGFAYDACRVTCTVDYIRDSFRRTAI